MSRLEAEPTSTPRLADVCILTYILLIVYGSLMPFDFRADWTAASRHLHDAFAYWPIGPRHAGRRDVFVNVVFYMPLGLLVAGRCIAAGRSRRFRAALAAAAVATGLSVLVEFLQSFTPSRTAQVSDVLANALGGLSGGVLASIALTAPNGWLRKRLHAFRVSPLAWPAAALLALLLADALDPAYPVLRLWQLRANLRGSHFDIVSGLGVHPWHHWLVCRLGVYAVLSVLLGASLTGAHGRSRWLKGALLAWGFALITECVKPFIAHREANIANVVTALGGCALGALAARLLQGRLSARARLAGAALLLVLYITYHEWKPFTFSWGPSDMAEKLRGALDWIPLQGFITSHGGSWEIRLLVRIVAVTAALAAVMGLLSSRLARSPMALRAVQAAALTGTLGLILEAGQFLIPGRSPCLAHVMYFAAGGALGPWLVSRIARPRPSAVLTGNTAPVR